MYLEGILVRAPAPDRPYMQLCDADPINSPRVSGLELPESISKKILIMSAPISVEISQPVLPGDPICMRVLKY